jgi:hypothetical protein
VRVRYDDEEVWRECWRIEAEAKREGWPVCQSLYLYAPLFVHPDRLVTPDALRWLEDHRLCTTLGVPPAATLDDVSARFADAVLVIERETAAATKYRTEQRNG